MLEHRTQEPTSKGSDHSQCGVGNREAQEKKQSVNAKQACSFAAAAAEIGHCYGNKRIDAGGKVQGKTSEKNAQKHKQ
jgi:hypothetical protein